jgi:putative NADPH-quinone reductase
VPPALAEAQNAIGWAEHIVFVYPLWLGSMPALLKAFLEQVLRPGFAIAPGSGGTWGKLMTGRSARVVVTMGMPSFVYRWFFLAHSLRSFERNILKFCGFGPVRSTVLGGVASGDSSKRLRWLDEMRALGRSGR